MSQPLDERLRYHPDPSSAQRGHRRVDARLLAIRDNVDLKGANVLDLGCSGGYFTFSLARDARFVRGVDADADVIAQDRAIAARDKVDNVAFQADAIAPDVVAAVPEHDVVLFLSVFHHMLASSTAYDANARSSHATAFDAMRAIREKADVLVFEMGQRHEPYEWAARMPPMEPSQREWILRNVIGAEFRHVRVAPAPALQRGALSWWRRRTAGRASTGSLVDRATRKALGVDARDGRDLFFAFKSAVRARPLPPHTIILRDEP